jgi:hypothetical protein
VSLPAGKAGCQVFEFSFLIIRHFPEKYKEDSKEEMDIPRREKPENIILVLKSAKCPVHAPLKEKLPELELLFHSDRGA